MLYLVITRKTRLFHFVFEVWLSFVIQDFPPKKQNPQLKILVGGSSLLKNRVQCPEVKFYCKKEITLDHLWFVLGMASGLDSQDSMELKECDEFTDNHDVEKESAAIVEHFSGFTDAEKSNMSSQSLLGLSMAEKFLEAFGARAASRLRVLLPKMPEVCFNLILKSHRPLQILAHELHKTLAMSPAITWFLDSHSTIGKWKNLGQGQGLR